MRENDISRGILDKTYAEDRQKKPQLVFRYKVRARIVANAAKRYLATSKPLYVLDFGSAEGLTLLELSSLLPFGTYIGVEYSGELLKCIPELLPNIRIIKGDVTDLPEGIKGESYDIVSALALLEHLSHPLKAVQEAASVLRPGGIFIATCPNPFWDTVSAHLGLLQGEHHETEMNRERMIYVVEKAGMEVLAYELFMWAPIGVLPYMKLPIPPLFSLTLDRIIRSVKIFDWLFVNQCIIARKHF